VYALAIGPSMILAGGGFTTIGGQFQPFFAALDRKTGAAIHDGGA
jgi:hypothetical protein